MKRRALLAALAVAAGCSDLTDIPLNVCGNHVVESGEQCDSNDPSCGQPDGGTVACRNVCPAGVDCPSGEVCGNDHVCRTPAGTFTLGAPFGDPASQFQLATLEGDALVVERGSDAVTLHRFRGGDFKKWATGPANTHTTNQHPPSGVEATVAFGQLDGDAAPLLFAFTDYGADLLTLESAGNLQPVVFPAVELAESPSEYLGTVTVQSDVQPLFYHASKNLIVSQPNLFGGTTSPVGQVRIDLGLIGGSLQQVAIAPKWAADTNLLALIVQQSSGYWVYVAHPDDAAFTTVFPYQLTVPSAYRQNPVTNPMVLDLDGDGLLDVLVFGTDATGQPVRIEWLQRSTFPWPVVTGPSAMPGNGLSVGDVNGDGRDDFMESSFLYLAHLENPDGGLIQAPAQLPQALVDAQHKPVSGDFNGDGRADLVTASFTHGRLEVCLGDGKSLPLFNCRATPSGLASVDSLLIADVNADLTNDVVVASSQATTTPDGGAPPGQLTGIALLLGQTAFPAAPSLFEPYHVRVLDLSAVPPSTTLGDQLLVSMVTDPGTMAFSLGHPSTNGVTFGFDSYGPVSDVRFVDDDGDGHPDLLLATGYNGVLRYLGSAQGGFSPTTTSLAFSSMPSVLLPGPRFVRLAGETAPGVVFYSSDSSGAGPVSVGVGRRKDMGYETTSTSTTFGYSFDDAVIDVDGDGYDELVTLVYAGADNHILISSFPAGQPPNVVDAGTLTHNAYGTISFMPSAVHPGRQSLVYAIEDPSLLQPVSLHVVELADDGTFDFAHEAADPPLLSTSGAPVPFDPSTTVMASVDLNGDNIPDLVIVDQSGAHAALADAVSP
jgi:hypothetical protein